jgi:thiol peroxidase
MTAITDSERHGAVTFKGNPMTLVGPALKPSDRAPDFKLIANDLSEVTLDDALANGTRAALLIVVPSIDTSVCSLETAKFNKQVRDLAQDKIATFTVSEDLPFAQKRWAEQEQVKSLQLLSDYKDHSFGKAYGVWIKELGLLARSVFIVDKSGTIRYANIVPEVALEPDYDEVIAAARAAAG